LTACTSKPFLGRVINVFVSQQDCYWFMNTATCLFCMVRYLWS
jgi:hypothetical protein